MFKFLIQALIVLLLFLNNRRSKGEMITPSSVLFGIYLIGALSSIGTLYIEDYSEPFSSSYWGPMLLFDFFLLLFLLPFRIFKESLTTSIVLPTIRVLNFISSVLIILSFFSILFYTATVMTVFSSVDLAESRNAVASGESLTTDTGWLNTIASISSSLYVFVLLFFFIYSCIGGHRIRRALLLVSSFSEPVHILTFVGRDGIVFWLFMFAFYYSFFYHFLHNEARTSIRKVFIKLAIVISIPFLVISIARFAKSDYGTKGAIVSYLGQGFINAPLLFGMEKVPLTHGASFPLFFEITGKPKPISLGYLEIGDWKSWTFSTFVGGFYRNLGMRGLVLLCFFLLFFFFITLGKKRRRIKLNHLIIYSLYYLIYSEGVFYFREYTRGGNLFILLCFVSYFVLSLMNLESRTPIIINRIDAADS